MSKGPITNARTPKFGMCMDEGTRTTDRCVVSEASCDSDEFYKSPYEISTAVCEAPEVVEIGRCTSDLDDKRCAAAEASCGTKSPFFDNIDPTCSLVADKTMADGARTTFPACVDLDNDVYQCVLDERDCFLTEKVNYAKWVSEWGPKECHCGDVPTGVCYKPVTGIAGKLTADNSFCAMRSRDCPDTHLWMSARDFLDSERATYDCRLCDETITGTGTAQSSYPVGGCLESGASSTLFVASSFTSCALERAFCPPGGAGFVSAQMLKDAGLTCPIERTDNWGVCGSSGDPVECTNKSDSCMYDFRFERNGDECDIHGHSKTALPTYFPYCSPRTDVKDRDWKKIRCVWDISECDSLTERWEEARLPDPNDAWFNGCTCEEVFTGVCQEPTTGAYHCAVSPNGCTDPSSYVPQRNLKERGIDMECQLCVPRTSSADSPPTAPPTDAPVAPVASTPTFSMVGVVPQPTYQPHIANRPTLPPALLPTVPTLAPQPVPTPTVPSEPTATSSVGSLYQQPKSFSTGDLVGMAVGAVVVCGLIVLIVTKLTGAATTKEAVLPSNNDEEEPISPTSTIT